MSGFFSSRRSAGVFVALCMALAYVSGFTVPVRAQTTSVFDVLAATETLTVVGTTTLLGNAFSIGTSTLVVSQGNVGIGTTTPQGQLHMVGPSSNQFLWVASSGSLRAGLTSGTQWSAGNIGVNSIAFGQNGKASGNFSTVGGGGANSALGLYSVVCGGATNETDDTTNGYTAVCGGSGNSATIQGAVVGGGLGNLASGAWASIGGGNLNVASGVESTVPGGVGNTAAGEFSFAAGDLATANSVGSFVWADSQNRVLTSNIQDEFKVRAGGGFVLVSSPLSTTVIVSSGPIMLSTSPSAASAVPNIFISSTNGGVGIGTSSPATKLHLSSGILTVDGTGAAITASGSSVTASAFFGDGAHLTNVAGGLSGGTNGYSMRWTGATAAGVGPFSETGSSATVVGGNSLAIAANGFFSMGNGANARGISLPGLAYYARSNDGVAESSGCVVVVSVDATSEAGNIVFTSTTSQPDLLRNGIIPGVLLESCSPGSLCRVGIAGIFRVITDASFGTQNSFSVGLSATRCYVTTLTGTGDATIGYELNQDLAAAPKGVWIRVSQR